MGNACIHGGGHINLNQCMYIGPSIPGVVKNSTIFIGELPERLTRLSQELPCINNLVVSIDEITKVKEALSEQGSVEDVSYRQIMDYLEGGK